MERGSPGGSDSSRHLLPKSAWKAVPRNFQLFDNNEFDE